MPCCVCQDESGNKYIYASEAEFRCSQGIYRGRCGFYSGRCPEICAFMGLFADEVAKRYGDDEAVMRAMIGPFNTVYRFRELVLHRSALGNIIRQVYDANSRDTGALVEADEVLLDRALKLFLTGTQDVFERLILAATEENRRVSRQPLPETALGEMTSLLELIKERVGAFSGRVRALEFAEAVLRAISRRPADKAWAVFVEPPAELIEAGQRCLPGKGS